MTEEALVQKETDTSSRGRFFAPYTPRPALRVSRASKLPRLFRRAPLDSEKHIGCQRDVLLCGRDNEMPELFFTHLFSMISR